MIFGRLALNGKALGGVVVFTIIETATLTLWLQFALQHNVFGALASLIVGLGIEHYIATQVGQQDK